MGTVVLGVDASPIFAVGWLMAVVVMDGGLLFLRWFQVRGIRGTSGSERGGAVRDLAVGRYRDL